jgi:NAD(P)-dependent dehydrogenase (short-subunit alcohol dehydrogenase family)
MDKFDGKVAVITGAGSGFGREFALKGATLGMKLVLADVDVKGLAETVEMARGLGAEALGVPTDVSDAAQVDALARTTIDTYGVVHLLFNNAGVGTGGFERLGVGIRRQRDGRGERRTRVHTVDARAARAGAYCQYGVGGGLAVGAGHGRL